MVQSSGQSAVDFFSRFEGPVRAISRLPASVRQPRLSPTPPLLCCSDAMDAATQIDEVARGPGPAK
ncbi:hypothetical protein GX51_01572 [Blastomyces parvus]|uniref:Uncharacterized protein n=1 Tax=Blastomyces parvus TaxID=2060905 RepID=A0A2B7XGM9_9EURO|nr:hypothetical protein GX51_01572 [Blastomyces parvus]